jgi:hypothetical protein
MCFERTNKEAGILIEVTTQLLTFAIMHLTQRCNRNLKEHVNSRNKQNIYGSNPVYKDT